MRFNQQRFFFSLFCAKAKFRHAGDSESQGSNSRTTAACVPGFVNVSECMCVSFAKFPLFV